MKIAIVFEDGTLDTLPIEYSTGDTLKDFVADNLKAYIAQRQKGEGLLCEKRALLFTPRKNKCAFTV